MGARCRAPSYSNQLTGRSGRLLGFDHLAARTGSHGNGPGLHGFGDLALERDVKQAVLKVSTGDLDMVGQLEAALEGARGDALVQELGLGFDLLGLLAGNRRSIL